MLHNFEDFLRGMWEEAESPLNNDYNVQKTLQKQVNSALTVKNIHQILPKGVTNNENPSKSAFRNL